MSQHVEVDGDPYDDFDWEELSENFYAKSDPMMAIVEQMVLVYQDIKTEGMSKDAATVIANISPEMLPSQCPINSYTVKPSETNLQVTVESISATTAGVIAAIITALASFVLSIITWLDKKKSSLAKTAESIQITSEQTKDAIVKMDETKREVGSKKITITPTLKTKIDNYNAAYTKLVSSALHDQPLKLSDKMEIFLSYRPHLIMITEEYLKNLNIVLDTDPRVQHENHRYIHEMASWAEKQIANLLHELDHTGADMSKYDAQYDPKTSIGRIEQIRYKSIAVIKQARLLNEEPSFANNHDPERLIDKIIDVSGMDWTKWKGDDYSKRLEHLEKELNELARRPNRNHLALNSMITTAVKQYRTIISFLIVIMANLERLQLLTLQAVNKYTRASLELVLTYGAELEKQQ